LVPAAGALVALAPPWA